MTAKTNDTPTLPAREAYAPNDLATALFGAEGAFQGGKRVRAYLRATYTRPADSKGKTWTLSPKIARETFDHFVALRTTDEPSDMDEGANA